MLVCVSVPASVLELVLSSFGAGPDPSETGLLPSLYPKFRSALLLLAESPFAGEKMVER